MNLSQIIFSKTAFMNEFYAGNSEETNVELTFQIFKDLISPDYDFSDLIDMETNKFVDGGQDKFIGQYILLMNKELGDVFYSQMNPSDYTPGMFQYVADFVGFSKEAVMETLVGGTLDLILSSVAMSILVFMGMTSGFTIPAAFLGAFLGYLLKLFLSWVGDKIEEYSGGITAVKNWASQVYADYVLPEDFTMEYENALRNIEIENEEPTIEMNKDQMVQNTAKRIQYYKEAFDNLGFLDMTNSDAERIRLIRI